MKKVDMFLEKKQSLKTPIGGLVVVGVLLWFIFIAKQNYILDNDCPRFIICESKDYKNYYNSYCGDFYLGAPIIYIIKDNPTKEYYAILHTFWVTKKEFQNMQCYDNEEDAQVAGYQPSEQAKKGIAAFEWLKKSPEERGYDPNSATNTTELLKRIDAVIGL